MNSVKKEVKTLLNKLPEECTFEDIQYHLYVIEKNHKSKIRIQNEELISQKEVEKKFSKWTIK